MNETDQNVWYPDTEFVEMITTEWCRSYFAHTKAGRQTSSTLAVIKDAVLESALASPKPVFGMERYPSLAEKAATLIWGITKNHPFNDGNKRAALTTGFSFLFVNRCVVFADQDESVQMCLGSRRERRVR